MLSVLHFIEVAVRRTKNKKVRYLFLSTSSLIKCMVFNWYLYHIFIDYLQSNSCFLNYVTMWQQWRGQTMAQAALFNVYNELASPIVYYNTSPVFPYSPKYHFLQLCNLRYKVMKNLAQNRCVLTIREGVT